MNLNKYKNKIKFIILIILLIKATFLVTINSKIIYTQPYNIQINLICIKINYMQNNNNNKYNNY